MADYLTLDDVRSMAAQAGAAAPQSYSLEDVQQMEDRAARDFLLKRETTDVAYGVRRGLRDALDTGAEGLAALWDKGVNAVSGVDPREYEKLKASNDAARTEVTAGRPTTPGALTGYVGGNALATTPILRGGQLALGVTGVPALQALGNSIFSGGMFTGNATRGAPLMARFGDMAARVAGGAASGFVSGGLADPDMVGTSTAIGAALPPAAQLVRNGAEGAARLIRGVRPAPGVGGADVRAARDIAAMSGTDPADLAELARVRDALRQQGPNIIPGQTVPEILQSPGVSQLQRSVQAVQPNPFVQRAADREAARLEVLQRIAPIGNLRDVAEEVGTSIADYATAAHRGAKGAVSAKFNAVDPFNQSRVLLPVQQMQAAKDKFLGPGTFGSGGMAQQAVDEAQRIGTQALPAVRPAATGNQPQGILRTVRSRRNGAGVVDEAFRGRYEAAAGDAPRAVTQLKPVTFEELQNLRSSIGEQWRIANRAGNAKEAAALNEQRRAIDAALDNLAAGNGQAGEFFAPDMVASYKDARAAHAAKELRFKTGPQSSIFRQGGDGLPMAQGGEIPRKFFNANASQLSDAQSFRGLVQNDARLMTELRRFAVSEAAEKGSSYRTGNLTNAAFNRWLDSRSGAVGEVFTEQQRAWLKAIAEDLRRADLAESLGRSTGSDTAQKAASMMRLGLMDSPGMRYAAGRVPGGGLLMDWLAAPARSAKADRFAGLLMDPERTGGLLDVFIATQQRKPMGLLGGPTAPVLSRAGPLLLPAGNQ